MALLTANRCRSFGELGMLAASGRRQACQIQWLNLTTALPLQLCSTRIQSNPIQSNVNKRAQVWHNIAHNYKKGQNCQIMFTNKLFVLCKTCCSSGYLSLGCAVNPYIAADSVVPVVNLLSIALVLEFSYCHTLTIRYDTIPDAVLTCARKPTWVSLIYRTETTSKKCKTEKLKQIWSEVTVKVWGIR